MLIRNIHAPWRDNDKFKKLLARIRKHEMDYTPDEIDRFLNRSRVDDHQEAAPKLLRVQLPVLEPA